MFNVYALKSLSHNFIYVGMTEDLNERFVRHNKGYVKSTKRYAPFKLFYSENCKDGKQAREREKFLKSTSGKRFLKSTSGKRFLKSILFSQLQIGELVDKLDSKSWFTNT